MGLDFFKKPGFRYALSGFCFAFVAYGLFWVGKPVAEELNASFAIKEFKQFGVIGTYHKHFFSFLDHFHGLAKLESDNESLRTQIAQFEKAQTLDEAGIAERELASMNEVLEKKVEEQAGASEALLPQTLGYEVPTHLMPSELYPLALAYFRKQEFEKTAALFGHLFRLPEDRKYETADNYLISGISWYHLKNYAFARKHIAEALHRSRVSVAVHRQALLWDAMIEKAEGKPSVAQNKLLQFIGQYPHSEEGEWINGGRKPARVEAKSETSEAKTDSHAAEEPSSKEHSLEEHAAHE